MVEKPRLMEDEMETRVATVQQFKKVLIIENSACSTTPVHVEASTKGKASMSNSASSTTEACLVQTAKMPAGMSNSGS